MCTEDNQKPFPHLYTKLPVVTMCTIKMYAMQNQVSILNSSHGDDTTDYEMCRMESQLFPDHLKWVLNTDFFSNMMGFPVMSNKTLRLKTEISWTLG
jgi:uncharacterized protein (DUF952 family)